MVEEKLLTTKELSEWMGIAKYTLVKYRMRGYGPHFIKIGRVVRYRLQDVKDWLESNKV